VTEVGELVRVDEERLHRYADEMAAGPTGDGGFELPAAPAAWLAGAPEDRAGLILALDAINYGSGWHPVLRKRPGLSGARTIAAGFTDWWVSRDGARPQELVDLGVRRLADLLGQDVEGPAGELMGLFATGLADLGAWVRDSFGGEWSAVVSDAQGSAARLAGMLAALPQWDDRAAHPRAGEVALYKRAQIAGADLALAEVARFDDLHRLTLMADNLVPHVLRLDGVLVVDPDVVARIDRSELLTPGSPAEVELRAVAVDAVERLAALVSESRAAPTTPAELDRRLWWRGRLPRYKASPRHRARCTWY
jgi:hypothetical protein